MVARRRVHQLALLVEGRIRLVFLYVWASSLPCPSQVLEDIALTVQNQLVARVPFCAFNGGNDVFVDAGNKSLGLQAMMNFTGALPHEV